MSNLLTGGSGLLGKELRRYIKCDTPSSEAFDITNPSFVIINNYETVIHAAAYTNVVAAEQDDRECYEVNVTGTYNLLRKCPNAYFVYISTEYAYNPVNFYSWTKLWGEDMVKTYSKNYLIIRTLFKPRPFPYTEAFYDQYTRGDYVDKIAPLIANAILQRKTGTIDIGTGRKTMLELAMQTRKVKSISVDDVKGVKLPKDYDC